MKIIFIITFLCYSFLIFGQDSLSIDTPLKLMSIIKQQTVIADAPKSTAKDSFIKKKKKNKLQKHKTKN